METASRLAECPNVSKVELNLERAGRVVRQLKEETGAGDIDIFVDGMPVQLKSTQSKSGEIFKSIIERSHKQANVFVIEYEDFDYVADKINMLEDLLRKKGKKRVFLFNKTTGNFFEVKYKLNSFLKLSLHK
ncbi:MAG: hypothetical protein N2560_00625 [Ignavibacteria bacterium]|nr:hypothetical protein [Ignavibacteria bacterium]